MPLDFPGCLASWIDRAIFSSSCKLRTKGRARRARPIPTQCACRARHHSFAHWSSASRRCGRSCWRAPARPAWAVYGSAGAAATARAARGCGGPDGSVLSRPLRSPSSPARVIVPRRVLPPVEWSFGVRPIQAAKWRADLKQLGSGVLSASRVAPIGPTPGRQALR
jgi:hypothetical protein